MQELLDSSVGTWGLFASAFISATIAPGGSEALLALMLSQSDNFGWLLVLIATLGNVLGALTTWLLGVWVAKGYSVNKFSNGAAENAIRRVRKWGVPALLFAWLPIIGDALCFAAGWLGLPLLHSVIAITIGKAFRYSMIAIALI